eukprot:gene13987-16532_t
MTIDPEVKGTGDLPVFLAPPPELPTGKASLKASLQLRDAVVKDFKMLGTTVDEHQKATPDRLLNMLLALLPFPATEAARTEHVLNKFRSLISSRSSRWGPGEYTGKILESRNQ